MLGSHFLNETKLISYCFSFNYYKMSKLFRNIEEPILALVDRWIIDYFSRILWKHFEEQGTVTNEWIDGFISERHCIQVLETQPGDNLDLLELQSRLLIQFMCKMSDGSFGTTIVNTDLEDGRTELEDAIELLEQIIAVGNHSMASTDLLRIRISVKQQAVYACCREGNFDLAAKVFFRQWKSWKTLEEMEARKNIAEVLDSRNHTHEHLKSLTYENTIRDCKQILRKIFNSMGPPFLVTAAKNVWERMKSENIVKEADSDYADIMNIKKEQLDKSVLFNRQTDVDISDSLVNEVCAQNGNMLTSTSSVSGLQILSDSKQPGIYAPSETLVTMMPAANKIQTYPLILWTNSVSSDMLSPAVSSSSVYVSDDTQVTVSNSFMQQRKEVVGPDQRMYLSLPSNQFSMQEDIYLNTVPVVSSQVYANTPLLQQPVSLAGSGSIQQMWSVPAGTANMDVLSESEPVVKLKRKRKRGQRMVNTQVAEMSLPIAPVVNQPLPLVTEVTKTSPTIKQRGKKIKSSTPSVTSVLEDRSIHVYEVPSSPETETKRPRLTMSVSLEPKTRRPSRNSRSQTMSSSNRDLSPEKVPVICLTKISSKPPEVKRPEVKRPDKALQKKLPPTEISKKSPSSKTRQQAAASKHLPKDSLSSYIPEAKRKTNNSFGLYLPEESLPRPDRKGTVFKKDLRPSAISPSPSESIGSKGKGSSSPVKKQVACTSRLVSDRPSSSENKKQSVLPSQIESSPKKGSSTKRGAWDQDETEKLYRGVQKYGHRWVVLAEQFPDRSAVDLYNKFKSIEKGKQLKLLKEKFGPA